MTSPSKLLRKSLTHNFKKAYLMRSLCCLMAMSVSLFISTVIAQTEDSRFDQLPTAEFHFARLIYSNSPYSRGSGRNASWRADYPDAEYHLVDGINRMTNIDIEIVDYFGEGGRLITLDNDQIFNYPWLYAVEVGQWYLSDGEAAQLREYLDRGGFLLVDDFWGEYEWQVFVDSMERVFPDRPIVELQEDDPVMDIFFEVDKKTQIPGLRGIPYGSVPHWRGIFDEESRLIVAINFNMDLGDAWEHAANPAYPAEMTAAAYRFAVNYIIYSMTH